MNRWICIHGHFYQPPRENPWLEAIEIQDSAYPYHDWNERITAECYEPNAFSRILDDEKRIVEIVNNYSQISFNFGPTLLSWLKNNAPEVYRAALEADQQSRDRFNGHGSALAQTYNHMIMPLADRRDKWTQVVWGIRDFQTRFKRDPEGMWLPETAVDVETMEIMAEQGIKFVILAPHQAAAVRRSGEKEWNEVHNSHIDPRKAYHCPLPSGKSMAVFFYDGPIAHDVAFGGLLKNGESFAERLIQAFPEDNSGQNHLVHIATDGETFGHHNRFGDMALSYCLHHLESKGMARITIYAEYLEKNPPEDEVKIQENSSWSCIHGVERWRSNCGCNSGMHPAWTQEWRAPLRRAMDELRDRMRNLYEEKMQPSQAKRELHQEDQVNMLKLLEMQRNAMLMYTSCGWFFDDISGIETVQVIQYAARALQLAQEISGEDYETGFIQNLAKAPGNVPELADGARVYENHVQPAMLNLLRVGAHYAISSLFEEFSEKIRINCYSAEKEMYQMDEAGKQSLAVGRVRLRSEITWEEERIGFAVLHFGDHNVRCGVRPYRGEREFNEMMREVRENFRRSDMTSVIDSMDGFFAGHNYSLWHLFRDEKRRVMERILESNLKDIEANFRQIYEHQYPTIRAMKDMKIPLSRALADPVEIILNHDFEKWLKREPLNWEKLKKLADEFQRFSFSLDKAGLALLAKQRLSRLMKKMMDSPEDLDRLKTVEEMLLLLKKMEIKPDLWESQNIFFKMTQRQFHKTAEKAGLGNQKAVEWVACFRRIGSLLGVKSP